MPRIVIDDFDDPRLEPYRHLKATNRTRWLDQFVAEGLLVAKRLLASRFAVESVVASEHRECEIASHVRPETPLYVVPHPLMERLAGFPFHSGVLACGRRAAAPELADIVARHAAGLLLAVCPDVNDPDNLGSLIRTCAALGVDAVVLGRGCADPFSRRVLRVSMGSAFLLPIVESPDLHADLRRLRDEFGVELVATVLDPHAEPLAAVRRPERLAILLGNEKHGLSREWIELCRRRVTIPMHPGADSLNVAVAGAIVLYHFTQVSTANDRRET